MKLRGLITDYGAMKLFMDIITSFSKLAKECIMRILPDRIYFILPDDECGPRRPYIWCELLNSYFFKEYAMKGVSETANEIYLSFSPAMFAKTLVAIRTNARSLKLKLTRDELTFLTVELDISDSAHQNRMLSHNIPIEIISRKEWEDYSEPSSIDFHVSLQLPSMKHIRNIVERMKNISTFLIVSANKVGRLTLKSETSLVNLSAHFSNLQVDSFAEEINYDSDDSMYLDTEDRSQAVKVSIDVRKFMSFATAMHVTNSKSSCSIVHGRLVKLILENSGIMTLQCYLTHVSD